MEWESIELLLCWTKTLSLIVSISLYNKTAWYGQLLINAMPKSQSAHPYWSKSSKLNEDNWVRESSDSGFLLATKFSTDKSEYWYRTSNTKPDIPAVSHLFKVRQAKSGKFKSCDFTLTLPAAVYILKSLKGHVLFTTSVRMTGEQP